MNALWRQSEAEIVAPPSAGSGEVRMLRVSQLSVADHLAWASLSRAASADSIFAASWFTQSVLAHFDIVQNYRLFVVVAGDGSWDGVFVAARTASLGRIPLAHLKNLLDANQFLGVPLVRRGSEERFWPALLGALDGAKLGCNALRLAEMPEDHRVTRALLACCEASNRAVEVLATKERAIWRPDAADQAGWSANLSAKQTRRFASLERQLAERSGSLETASINSMAELHIWISEFLALELAGWKGTRGSALASSSATASHFRFVAEVAFAERRFRALALRANGRPAAMSCYFLDQQHGFGFKMAFDEEFARYAPGLILKKALMEMHQATPGLCFDSCSDPDASAINKLWPERRQISDYLVSIGDVMDKGRFRAAVTARGLWHRAKMLRR